MWWPEEPWSFATGPLDSALTQLDIALYVRWRLEMELSVEVSVIADLMTFACDAPNQIGPSLGVCAKNEEGRFHPVLSQSVENSRCGIRVGPVIERERNCAACAGKLAEYGAKNAAVAMKHSVCGSADQSQADRSGQNHTVTWRLPRTAA